MGKNKQLAKQFKEAREYAFVPVSAKRARVKTMRAMVRPVPTVSMQATASDRPEGTPAAGLPQGERDEAERSSVAPAAGHVSNGYNTVVIASNA